MFAHVDLRTWYLYIYICKYMCKYTYIYIYAYIHIHINIHTHTCVHSYMHAYYDSDGNCEGILGQFGKWATLVLHLWQLDGGSNKHDQTDPSRQPRFSLER